MGILRKLFLKKEASGVPGGAAAQDVGLTCAVCAKDISNYHYSFESIMNAQVLGWQCPDCGQVFCHDHVVGQSGTPARNAARSSTGWKKAPRMPPWWRPPCATAATTRSSTRRMRSASSRRASGSGGTKKDAGGESRV